MAPQPPEGAPQRHEATMTYSVALLRRATWRKWQALFSWRYALAVLLMGGAVWSAWSAWRG